MRRERNRPNKVRMQERYQQNAAEIQGRKDPRWLGVRGTSEMVALEDTLEFSLYG